MLADEVHKLGWGVCSMMLVNQNFLRIFLSKKDALTEDEFQVIKNHTMSSMEVIRWLGCYGEKVLLMVEASTMRNTMASTIIRVLPVRISHYSRESVS
jgi:hypothetical protein